MTQQQYRNQFENQVKDLIAQYAEIHGHGPDVTIQWGKGDVRLPTIPISERIKKDIEFDDAIGRSDPDERSWGMQNGILISKREARLFIKLLADQKHAPPEVPRTANGEIGLSYEEGNQLP